jgi:hypothetical protein
VEETMEMKAKIMPLPKYKGAIRTSKTPSMEAEIRRRADDSMALLGMAFVRNGSGSFLNIRAEPPRVQIPAGS